MDVKLPDGRVVRNVPDGITKTQLMARIQKLDNPAPKAEQSQKKEGFVRTAFDQGMQGATFGFADEVTDTIGAGIASLATGEDFGTLRKEARELTKERQERQFDQRPATSILANIAGAVLTGGAGATTKVGTKAGNLLRSGNVKTRVAKSAGAGAVSGATFGAGTADDGERLDGAIKGGVAGVITGGAVAAAPHAVKSALAKKPKIPNADELRAQASTLYQKADKLGGNLKTEFTDEFLDKVQGLRPQTEAGKILAGDSPFTKVVDRIDELRGKPLSLQAAQEIDEFLGDAIDGFTEMGRVTKQGKKLLDIQSSFRNMIEEADETLIDGGKEGFKALKEGRKLWKTSRKLEDIERIIQRAELMDNPAQGIKSGFRTMLNNPNRLKGYTKAEKEAIKKAAESGVVTDLFRTMGSRLIPIITAGSGAGGLGGTAAASAASAASRNAATRVQVGKAKQLADLVAVGGTPPVKQITNQSSKNPLLGIISAQEAIRQ